MRYFLFSLLIIFSACNKSAFNKKVQESDSIVINFNYPHTDSIVRTVATTDRKAINRMKEFIDTKKADPFTCGYDGHIIFFSKGVAILPVVFQFNDPACRHFLFQMDGATISTVISNETADFLDGLAKGKNEYW